MYAYLQSDGSSGGCIDISGVGTDTGTGHPQQSRIPTRLDRYAENALNPPIGSVVGKVHFVDIHVFRTPFG